ncbi:MAG: YdeI/OmpD-associated family protein [Candidatus Aminicenantales bacterium]
MPNDPGNRASARRGGVQAGREYRRRMFKNRKEWRSWLEKHHDKEKGIWLLYYKKGSGKSSITYAEALEEALSFGWIDSTARKVDGERYMQKYTPRNERSLWSALNKERVARLIAEGRMTEHGLAKIEAAKRNGCWTRIDAVDRGLEVPRDLLEALEGDREAGKLFARMAPSSRKLFSWWVASARKPETRARRIVETIVRVKAGRRPGT